MRSLSNGTISINELLIRVEQELQLAKDKISALTSIQIIKMFEEDIEKLQQEKANLILIRDNKEDQQVTIETLMNYVFYYFEHFEELLIGSANPIQNAAFFGLLFEELPTYDDLVSRTPKLACIFKLKREFDTSKNPTVSRQGLEP